MSECTEDYLLNKRVKVFQPKDGYRASIDAVFLSAMVNADKVKGGEKILDVGSGTGAVSLCLAYRLAAKNVQIAGLDIQQDLVDLSNRSASANGFASFLTYQKTDIRQKICLLPASFDIVVTNPPYSDHDMPSPKLGKQLAHNHQNFDLAGWLKFCLKMLRPKGEIFLINRAEALNEILSVMHNRAGDIQILPLYSKHGQNAKRIIVNGKKGSRGITKILPPLYTHNEDGTYTNEAEKILRQAKSCFDI